MNAALVAVPEDGSLLDYEQVIEDNLLGFVRVGLSLRFIKERGLFKDGYGTWSKYLEQRWSYSRAHAGRLMNGAETWELLAGEYGDEHIPPHERPLRPLISEVPKEAQLAVWGIIEQTAPAGVVDGKHIALVVSTLKEVVITQAVEDGTGGQIHVSQALKAAITTEVYERYKSERAYTDAVHTPALYQGRGVVVALEGSRVTLELEAAPDVSEGQTVKVYLNSHKERG